jgi:F-type H+-transporting ATPase subunit b
LLLILLAAPAFMAQELPAQGERIEDRGERDILWKWLNFAILAGGLGYLTYRNGGAFFRSRTEAIRKGIEEADRLRREAEARVAEMEARLKNLEAEVQELRTRAGQEMAAENERLRREAEDSLRKIREQAEQEIASASKAARHEVQAHAAELAVGLAAAKIRSLLTPQADETLVAAFLNDLEERAGDSPRKELN